MQLRARRLALVLLVLSVSGGCIASGRLNADCRWVQESSTSDGTGAAVEKHLVTDVEVAEELAIRYADVQRGRRSGRFVSNEDYQKTREQCLAVLFSVVRSVHGVPESTLQSMRGRRISSVDASVLAVFGALYLLVCFLFAHRIQQRTSRWWRVGASLVLSAMVAAGGTMLLELWAGVVEMLRVHDTHLSYRADRLPWQAHRADVFAGAVVLFLLVVAVSALQPRPQE